MSADLDIPAGARTSTSPIEGGVVVVNAAVAPGEPGHETWRTLTNEETKTLAAERAVAVASSDRARWSLLRVERDRRLRESDWTELPSAAGRLTSSQRKRWEAYRQTLRDLPGATKDPDDPPWPTQPD